MYIYRKMKMNEINIYLFILDSRMFVWYFNNVTYTYT